MTSNIGANLILDSIENNVDIKQDIDALLKTHFRPEFLNRLDDIIMFKPLSKEEIKKIVDLLLKDLQKRLLNKQLNLIVDDSAKEFIIENGYDVIFGARPLKRYISHNVETMVAKELLTKDFEPNQTITLTVENGELELK